MKITKIEINFPIETLFSSEHQYKLNLFVSDICKQNQKPGRCYWPAGQGMRIDRMPVVQGDERIEFSDNVYAIDCFERKDYGKEHNDT